MELNNNLLNFRLKLGYKYSKEFAIFLGINPAQYSRYENNSVQPEPITLYKIYLKIKSKDPNLHLEDLLICNTLEE